MTSPRKEILAEGVELWLGDCGSIVPSLPKDWAIVSDPPYGIAWKHRKGPATKFARFTDSIVGDDKPFDPAPFLEFSEVILWGANHYACRLPPSARWLVWDKKCGVKEDSYSDAELAWSKMGGSVRVHRQLWNGILAREVGERRQHVMQKPIDLMKWCIGWTVSPVICDPFMGSGTTGIAAVQLGRKFTGVEIDHRHYEIAHRRISAALRQQDLFIEKPKPAKQEALPL